MGNTIIFTTNIYLILGERKTRKGVQVWKKEKENKRKRNSH